MRIAFGGMAVVAGRRNMNAAQRRMTMNAAEIHFYRFMIRDLVFGDQVDILMAPTARSGKISWIDVRSRIVDREDIMLAVAIAAGRDIIVLTDQRPAMAGVGLGRFLMTEAAISGRNHIVMW